MEAGSPRSPWCQHTQVLVSSLFLVYRWPPSHLVLTGWREEALMSLPLLKRALIPSGGSTPMTFSKLNYHPKTPPPSKYHPLEVRASSCEFWWDTNTESITEGLLSYLKCVLTLLYVYIPTGLYLHVLFCFF